MVSVSFPPGDYGRSPIRTVMPVTFLKEPEQYRFLQESAFTLVPRNPFECYNIIGMKE